MTAAPPSEGRPLWVRTLSVALCASLAWTPWALTWGDAFSEAAAAGQASGASARELVPAPSTAGQSVVLPASAGGNLDFGALFPSSTLGSPADFSALYGNHAAVMISGQAAQRDLLNDGSPTGAAYQALRSSVDRSRPDMRLDPLWFQTDNLLDNFEAISRTFADCTTETTFTNSTRETHIPDYRTCDRLVDRGGSCSWYHDYELPDPQPMVSVSGAARMTACGDQCVRVEMTRAAGEWDVAPGTLSFPVTWPVEGRVVITDPGRVLRITATLDFGDPPLPPLPEGYLPWQEGASYLARIGSRTVSSSSSPPPSLSDADMTEALRAGGPVQLMAYKSASARMEYNDGCVGSGCDFSITASVAPSMDLAIDIHYQPLDRPLSSLWGPNDGCYELLNTVTQGFCGGTVQCLGSPPLAPDGCYAAPGVRVCPPAMSPPPVPGENPFCTEIRVTADCSTFNTGQMDCWTDPQGNLQCPYNEGGHPSDCAVLEQDSNCGFIASRCVPGATDERGVCYLFEETWDCGALHAVPVLDRVQSVNCAGPVRCMGTDCAGFQSEQSGDFSNAVAALQAAQMAVTDMQCNAGGSCRVFSGEARECKRAVGGIVNCCKTPEGVSLTNYMNLVFAVAKIDSALMGLDKGTAIRGSWEILRQPITSTWSAVQESFTSVANNLMGQTTASATDAAASLGLDGFKQALLRQTAEWAAQLFGDAAVNALFSTTTGGAAVSGGAVAEGSVLQLGGGGAWLGTAMAWAMYAYLIYTVAVILVQLIWTCEQAEFELGAKRELRACHRVGGYCKSKVLGVCIEKRDSYCCFNSPLARIFNEQVRPQLGRDWGEPEAPLCGGLSTTELARVDWSRVNSDEWLAILYETGHFPTLPTLTLEDLTGTGSELAVETLGRPDAADRTAQRAEGIDSEQVRMDAEDELWGGTLPTLPSP